MEKETLLRLYMDSFKDAKPTHFHFIWDCLHNSGEKNDYRIFVDDFNAILERNFKYADPKANRQLKAVRKAGYTQEDDLKVIKALKEDAFHQESDFKYCTPEYATRMNIYEKYRNQYREVKPFNPNQIKLNPFK